MIRQQEALRLFGCWVFDPHGQRIGIVGQLFLDDQTDEPEWITVQAGLFGTNESFVPLAGAAFDGDTLTVAVFKRIVRIAPRVALVQGDLPLEQEQALYRYYGINPIQRGESVDREYVEAVQLRLRHCVTAQ